MITVNNAIKFSNRKQPNDMELKGLSTDVKPTEIDGNRVAVNSIFLELDTKDFYYFTGETWEKVQIEDSSGEYDRDILEINRKLNTKVRYFDTVANMKSATDLKAGDMVVTKGYYEPNDGGGATYYVREQQNNENQNQDGGVIHLLENELVSEMIVDKDTINVKQFGAKGDGVTDDYSAIFNALTSSYNVEFDKSTYAISQNIELNNVQNLVIYGNFATIKMLQGTRDTEFPSNEEPAELHLTNCKNIMINELTADVNGDWSMRPHVDYAGARGTEWNTWYSTRKSTYGGVALWFCDNISLNNVTSKNCRAGFFVHASSNSTIEDCESFQTFADGVYIAHNSKNVKVKNHYCEKTGDDCYTALGYGANFPKLITYSDCVAKNCGGALLCASSAEDITFENLFGTDMNYNPLKYEAVFGDCNNVKIINCHAKTNSNPELGYESAFAVGSSGTTYKVNNVLIKDSSVEYTGASSRRIEFWHREMSNIQYVNYELKNITPVFFGSNDNISFENCKLDIQDAIYLQEVNNFKLLDNVITNKCNFTYRGEGIINLANTQNVTFLRNAVDVNTDNNYVDIILHGTNTNFETDNDNFNAHYSALSNLKFAGIFDKSFYFQVCKNGQLARDGGVVGQIFNGVWKDSNTVTMNSDGLTLKLFRRGKVVNAVLTGSIETQINQGESNYQFNIPNEYKPISDQYAICTTQDASTYMLACKVDGRFGVGNAFQQLSVNTSLIFSMSWIAND